MRRLANPRQRFRDWYDASIGNRFAAALFLLTLGFVLLTSIGNFAYLARMTVLHAEASLDEQHADLTREVTHLLDHVSEHYRALSQDPTIVSAVLNARHQATEVQPILERQQPHRYSPIDACVTDDQGRPFTCLRPGTNALADSSWLNQVIAQGRPSARIERVVPDHPVLILAFPVVHEGTGAAEGAVVASFDLVPLVRRSLEGKASTEHTHLLDPLGDLLEHRGNHAGMIYKVAPLPLAEPLAGLQLRLGVTVQRTHFYGPLLRLTGAYLLIALLIVAGAIWAVRIVVPPLIARLSVLTRQANDIADGGLAEFNANELQADEIGQLSHAFAQMVRRLNAANESLERTVQERTAELRASENYNKALFANSYIPMVVMDPANGVFIDCNDAAVDIYRLSGRHQVLGKTVLDVSTPTQYDGSPSAAAAAKHVAKAREQGLQVFEWRHRRADGQEWDAEVRLMSLQAGGKDLLQFSLRDITAQKLAEADIWRRANFDALTGLANRNLLRDRLERAIANARRSSLKLGVLFLDLDGFKAVNDTLGHGAGDELLIEAARRLERCVREQDTAARQGGDEFVLLIHHLESPEDLSRVATAALASLNQPFFIAGSSRQISTSIGIAVYPDDADTADILLDLADRALYRAKNQGKNRYRFHDPALD